MGCKIDYNLVIELIKTKTIKQTALHLKVSYSTLYDFCRRNNLKSSVISKLGRKPHTDQHIDAIIKCYFEGMSQNEIAKKVGVCQMTVHNIIKKTSHHMRTKSEAARLRDANKTPEELKRRAAAANAVRMAMGIINRFG